MFLLHVFFFKQKTAYEMRISDWSSDVCSSDLSRESVEDAHVEQSVGARVEIIEAEQALEPVAFVEQLEFLADLFVEIKAGDVDIDRGQRVEVDRGRRTVLAPGADRAER